MCVAYCVCLIYLHLRALDLVSVEVIKTFLMARRLFNPAFNSGVDTKSPVQYMLASTMISYQSQSIWPCIVQYVFPDLYTDINAADPNSTAVLIDAPAHFLYLNANS